MSVDPVILELRAEVAEYNRRVDQARKRTDTGLGAIEKRFSAATKAAVQFATGFITIDLARRFLEVADEAKNLDAQMRLATAGFGSFAQAGQDVRRIAADTRSGLSETAALYGNFSRATKELGGTQSEAARATETFAKTLKISGADANSAASATLQFGQALASGALRGDELNSILEASPRLARLLTESMGVSIGAIKQLGEEGKLTSDVLFRALTDRKFTDGIDSEFRQLPVTFDEAMTSVYNAAIVTIGAFDRGGQFSTAIANFVSDGSDGFASLESAAEAFGRTLSSELAGVIAVAESVIDAIRRINDGLGGLPKEGINKLGEYSGYLTPTGIIGKVIKMTPMYRNAAADREKRLIGDKNDQWAADQFRGRDVMGNRIGGAPRSTPAASPTKRSGSRGPSAESIAAKAERDRLKAIRDEAEQARDKARLEDEIINARASLATAAKDIYAFEMQMIDREKAARLTDIDTRVKMGELSEAAAKEQKGLVSELAQARALRAIQNRREADQAQQERQLRDDSDTLQTLAQATTNRRERIDIERRILDIQQQIERARLEEAIAAGQVADAAKARANLETRQAAENTVLARDSQGPLARYMEGLRQTRENVNDQVEALVVEELDQVRDGIRGAIEKRLGIKDPLISGLLNMLIENVVMKPLAEALSKSGGGGGGGLLGSIVSGIGAIFGGSSGFGSASSINSSALASLRGRASGGRVNAGEMYRVNEAGSAGRVEAFIPQNSGTIIPLGQMNALQGRSNGVEGKATVRLELSGDIDARIQQVSGPVAVEVVRASAPALVEASAQETMRRASRPRI